MSRLITEAILGEKHIVDIIVFLHSFGPRSKTEIYRAISTSPHMPNKLSKLEDSGLLDTFCVSGSKKKLIRLTDLGNNYADAICGLENKSGGNIDNYKNQTVKDMLVQMERIEGLELVETE